MKLFSVKDANGILPILLPGLRELSRLYAALDEQKSQATAASRAAPVGGGMIGGAAYIKALYRIAKWTTDITSQGIQIKDARTGLIDFPSLHDDRIVLLCWRLGEEACLQFWHELDGGFTGRRRL